MRIILTLLGIACLVLVALMQFGAVSVSQTRTGSFEAPAFKADVARVSLGTENKTVQVPEVEVQKPGAAQ